MLAEGSSRASRARRAAAALGLAALALGAIALAARPLGPELVEVASPDPGSDLPNEALEVFVGFPHPDRTLQETLEVRLNGADVTDAFSVAANGAYGSVVGVLDGENELRVGVFGRAWWPGGRIVEHTRVIRFRVHRPIDADWA
jgi:hypothetical protein